MSGMPNAAWTEARRALAAAAEWRLAGLLFERPRARWANEIAALSDEVADTALQRGAAAARSATSGEYLEALGPGGAVSPREVAYRGRQDPGHIVADVRGFYEAFAFQPQSEDPPDHVAVEAGFVGWLHLKEAYARARGDEIAAGTCAEARERFLAEHLRHFVEPLFHKLEPIPIPHLALAAQALLERAGPALAFEATPCEDGDDALGCDGCSGAGPGAAC